MCQHVFMNTLLRSRWGRRASNNTNNTRWLTSGHRVLEDVASRHHETLTPLRLTSHFLQSCRNAHFNGAGLPRRLKNESKILPTVFRPRRGHLRLHTGIKDNLPQREKCPQRSCALQQNQVEDRLSSRARKSGQSSP